MKYYNETIPQTLAEKLKEKGMPLKGCTIYSHFYPQAEFRYVCTYADVFDWLIEKEIYTNAYPERVPAVTQEYMYEYRPYVNGQIGKDSERTFDWHEAANAAIEKALTLI